MDHQKTITINAWKTKIWWSLLVLLILTFDAAIAQPQDMGNPFHLVDEQKVVELIFKSPVYRSFLFCTPKRNFINDVLFNLARQIRFARMSADTFVYAKSQLDFNKYRDIFPEFVDTAELSKLKSNRNEFRYINISLKDDGTTGCPIVYIHYGVYSNFSGRWQEYKWGIDIVYVIWTGEYYVVDRVNGTAF